MPCSSLIKVICDWMIWISNSQSHYGKLAWCIVYISACANLSWPYVGLAHLLVMYRILLFYAFMSCIVAYHLGTLDAWYEGEWCGDGTDQKMM
jgi:hypothetical protein